MSSEHREAKPITDFDHTDMSVPASVVRDQYNYPTVHQRTTAVRS